MERIERLYAHLNVKENHTTASSSRDEVVVIVSALRTPITKAKRGAFKDTTPDVLLSHVNILFLFFLIMCS
jgi:acetyl-CoA acyltransferase 1